MPADKSWQGDQSAVHPDQNHTPDTAVVFPRQTGEIRGKRFRRRRKGLPVFFCFFFKTNSLSHSALSTQNVPVCAENMEQLKTSSLKTLLSVICVRKKKKK